MYPFIRWQLGPNYATNDKQKISQNKTIFILSLLGCRNWTKNAKQKKNPMCFNTNLTSNELTFSAFFKQLICKRQHVTNCNQLTSETGTVKKASRWNKPKRHITQIREEVQLLMKFFILLCLTYCDARLCKARRHTTVLSMWMPWMYSLL